jgi:hypothetical protein
MKEIRKQGDFQCNTQPHPWQQSPERMMTRQPADKTLPTRTAIRCYRMRSERGRTRVRSVLSAAESISTKSYENVHAATANRSNATKRLISLIAREAAVPSVQGSLANILQAIAHYRNQQCGPFQAQNKGDLNFKMIS